MRKLFGAALLALSLLPGAASAHGFSGCGGCLCWNWPQFKIHAKCNFCFNISSCCPGGGAQLGPWYNYWPLEAHFQTPAFPNYPYWPSPQTLPGDAAALAGAGSPAPFDIGGPPTGFSGQAPSYWGGH